LDHGGEVLRFVGDAVLAIFPIREDRMDAREACNAALTASHEAEHRMAAYNEERAQDGKEALDFGVGMHVGDVLYGNVGVAERLDFTVTGSAANEAARIEDMTKKMGKRILFSCAFARNVDIEMEHLGPVDLRGVDSQHHVFAPVFDQEESRVTA
jgi:adenylate cyclase